MGKQQHKRLKDNAREFKIKVFSFENRQEIRHAGLTFTGFGSADFGFVVKIQKEFAL